MDIAKEISKGLADRIVIAKVDGNLWDLERPLEKACSLELLDFEHPEGEYHLRLPSLVVLILCSRKARFLAFICPRTW